MSDTYYAAFVKSSYHIPGDERSRTNPGHGYPEHTVEYTSVKKFASRQQLQSWVELQVRDKNADYEVVECTPMSVKTEVKIEIS
jgi:hypothetical protein